jgi:Tol biopolymer transport system component
LGLSPVARDTIAVISSLLVTVYVASAASSAQASDLLLMETPPTISVSDGSQSSVVVLDGTTPSWTRDGRIIFVSGRSGSKQIWIFDGSNATQIGQLPPQIQPLMPQMAGNGKIVFAGITPATQPDSNQSIFVMNPDGSGLQEVAQGMAPTIAPSGTWIAYTYQTDAPYHRYIFRTNIDGTGERQLTYLDDPDYPDANYAAISPDETQIAIFSGKEADRNSQTQSIFTFGHHDIAVISAAGGPRRKLTSCVPVTTQAEIQASTQCIAADEPAWTSDGRSLVLTAMFKTGTGTWMIDLDGHNFRPYYPRLRGLVRVPFKYQ